MQWNPFFDPQVEASYRGYVLRAIAHRVSGHAFTPMLQISDGANHAHGASPLYEYEFEAAFSNADEGLRYATSRGQETINNLLARLADAASAH
jgi:hypothetical protein